MEGEAGETDTERHPEGCYGLFHDVDAPKEEE
jgi:hypothetical protein